MDPGLRRNERVGIRCLGMRRHSCETARHQCSSRYPFFPCRNFCGVVPLNCWNIAMNAEALA